MRRPPRRSATTSSSMRHAVDAEGALVRVAVGGRTWGAAVGQQETQGGLSQWLQRSDRISMCSVGNVPVTSVAIQSRLNPSGTWFSVLHATTQSMQPTPRTVSMTMPNLATGHLRRFDGDEVHVHAGAAHERIGRIPRHQLRVARPLLEGVLQPLGGVSEAVHHVHAVGANALRGFHANPVAEYVVLIPEAPVIAGLHLHAPP